MSSILHAVYTKRRFNPGSIAIRLANPVSITTMAPASHVITLDGGPDAEYGFEAHYLHGVRRVKMTEALHGAQIVARCGYQVPDAEAGLAWLKETADRKAKYDFKGALGLGLGPGRNWQEDSDWFCFELHANAMAKAGRKAFHNTSHVSAYMMISLEPSYGIQVPPKASSILTFPAIDETLIEHHPV